MGGGGRAENSAQRPIPGPPRHLPPLRAGPCTTEPGGLPLSFPVLTRVSLWPLTRSCHPQPAPVPQGLTRVGGISPRGRARPCVEWPCLALGHKDPEERQPPPSQEASGHQGGASPAGGCACGLPVPSGPSKAPGSGGAGTRCSVHEQRHCRHPQALCPIPGRPGHLPSQAPGRLRQTGPPVPSPALQPPAWTPRALCAPTGWSEQPGLMLRLLHCLPKRQLPHPHSSHSCGEPWVTQPLCSTPQAAEAPQPLPPKCSGPVMGSGAGKGLTAGSAGRSEGYRGGGWPAVAGAGTCGQGRPHCRWCRTLGGTGDLQRPGRGGSW